MNICKPSLILILFIIQIIENLNADQSLADLSKLGIVDASNALKTVFEIVKHEESAKLDPKIITKKFEKTFKDQVNNISIVVEPGFKIEGLSKIKLNNFKCIINFSQLKLNISADAFVPELRGTGNYSLNGKALKLIPVNGKGDVVINLRGVTGNASISAVFNGTQFVVNGFDFKSNISNINLYLANLIQPSLSNFFNTFLNFLAKPLVDKLLLENQDLIDNVKLNIIQAINKMFAKFDANTLLKIFKRV